MFLLFLLFYSTSDAEHQLNNYCLANDQTEMVDGI